MSLEKNIVFVDGVRTPFLRAGTGYADLATYELGHLAIKGLLSRTGINPTEIDGVVMGNVVANVKTHNVARESALLAGVPESAPCHPTRDSGKAMRKDAPASLEARESAPPRDSMRLRDK